MSHHRWRHQIWHHRWCPKWGSPDGGTKFGVQMGKPDEMPSMQVSDMAPHMGHQMWHPRWGTKCGSPDGVPQKVVWNQTLYIFIYIRSGKKLSKSLTNCITNLEILEWTNGTLNFHEDSQIHRNDLETNKQSIQKLSQVHRIISKNNRSHLCF